LDMINNSIENVYLDVINIWYDWYQITQGI